MRKVDQTHRSKLDRCSNQFNSPNMSLRLTPKDAYSMFMYLLLSSFSPHISPKHSIPKHKLTCEITLDIHASYAPPPNPIRTRPPVTAGNGGANEITKDPAA